MISLLFPGLGSRSQAGAALNIVLSVATVALLYVVARRMLGRSAPSSTGGTWAISPVRLYVDGLFMSESLFIFTLVGVLALAVFLAPTGAGTATVDALGSLSAPRPWRGEGLLDYSLTILSRSWWRRTARGAFAGVTQAAGRPAADRLAR